MVLNHELYRYCTPGQRSVKYAPSGQQVRYFPGLEIRTCPSPPSSLARWHVIAAGHSRLYRAGRQTFCHFNLCDRTGSTTGVVNETGQWVSRESFYPFGGTACWLTGSQAGAAIKFQRYAGRERDATGLSCYEWRYYVPWVMRWLNSDPAGAIDGLNLFRMVRNNPISLTDRDGRMVDDEWMPDEHPDNIEMPYLAGFSSSKQIIAPSLEPVPSLNTLLERFNDEAQNLKKLMDSKEKYPPAQDGTAVIAKTLFEYSIECHQCKQNFVSDKQLLKHRKDTGCKFIYKCKLETCHKAWKNKSSLERHMLTHNQEKKILCEYEGCGKNFNTEDNYNAHRKRCHMMEKKFPCLSETCRMRFSSKKNRDTHFSFCQHTQEECRFRCIFCDNWYTSPYLVNRHVIKYHPLSKPAV